MARWSIRSALANRIVDRLLRLAVAGPAITTLIRIGNVAPMPLVVDCLVIAYGISWADAALDQILLSRRITMRNWSLSPFALGVLP